MKTNLTTKKHAFSDRLRQAGILLTFPLFLFGAASCSSDTREGDQEVAEDVNTELEGAEWEAREGQNEWEENNNENVAYNYEERFQEYDTDRDQRLSYDEFEAIEEDNSDRLREWDTNQDEQFSERELNEGLFHNWDRDKNGTLGREEYQAYNTAWGERYGDNFTTWDRNKDDRLDQGEFDAGVTEAGTYDAWDVNSDGVISREELRRGPFESRDADRDSYLTSEEYQDMDYNIWGLGDL